MEFRDAHRSDDLYPSPELAGGGRYHLQADAKAFRFGIEEEFFLCEEATLLPAKRTPDKLFASIAAPHDARAGREMLQSQLELATGPCTSFEEARAQLTELREQAARAAGAHGLAILACGTHPLGSWRNSVQTPKRRYSEIMDSLQIIGRRNMLCGMHVHVEVPAEFDRIRLMSRMLPYIPLFIALATSSPFWNREKTGLAGYRLAAYDELPRTGIPELFYSESQYQEYVRALVQAGAAPDASYVWWAIRPSLKYPTLELRAPDSCTSVSDAIAIAALYRGLVAHLCRDEAHNCDLDVIDRAIAVENKWRAQRYGTHATFVTRSGPVTVAAELDRLLDRLGGTCAANWPLELEHCRRIVKRGTSADIQSNIFESNIRYGTDFALREVAEWLRKATVTAA